MRDDFNGWKYLPVATLRALLARLPDDYLVGPNAMLNLAVVQPDRQYLGYIEFAGDGSIELERTENGHG